VPLKENKPAPHRDEQIADAQSAARELFLDLAGCADKPDLAQRHADWCAAAERAHQRYERLAELCVRIAVGTMAVLAIGAVVGSFVVFPAVRVVTFWVSVYVGWFAYLGAQWVRLRFSRRPFEMRAFLLQVVVTGGLWWYLMIGLPDPLVKPSATGLLGIVIRTFVVVGSILLALAILFGVVVETTRAAVYRQAGLEPVAVHSVTVALAAVTEWRSRDRMIECLNRAATAIQRVRLTCGLPDALAQAIHDRRFFGAAQAVRATGLWVALPGPGTQVALQQFLADVMLTLLTGHYDTLPSPLLQPSVERRIKIRAALSALRTILLGLIPLAVLLAVRGYGVPVAGQLFTAAGVLGLAFFLAAVDPRSKDHADLAKNLSGLVTAKPDK
jgi:hypothetical protein